MASEAMPEDEYQADLSRLREEWGRVEVDPQRPGILRTVNDPLTGILVGQRARLFAEIVNRAING